MMEWKQACRFSVVPDGEGRSQETPITTLAHLMPRAAYDAVDLSLHRRVNRNWVPVEGAKFVAARRYGDGAIFAAEVTFTDPPYTKAAKRRYYEVRVQKKAEGE